MYDYKKQVEIDKYIKQKRIETLIPQLLEKHHIDLWLVVSREYNEDPLFEQLTPMTEAHVSRMAMLLFHKSQRYAISGHDFDFYTLYWDHKHETQWQALARFIHEKKPKTVALNRSDEFPLADGLSASLYEKLCATLKDTTIISSENLVINILETRLADELDLYPMVYDQALKVILQSFDPQIIQPGITTTRDLELHLLTQTNALGLSNWFKPDVALQRKGQPEKRLFNQVINYGDLIQVDFGLGYLGLCTDTQRLLYINRPGELPPPSFNEGIANSNRFQDIVMAHFKVGLTGNQVLKASLDAATKEGLKAKLYTHPIGSHGHGIGPSVGMWDNQIHIPLKGDLIIQSNSCYALELNTATFIPEWDQEVVFFLEETVKIEDDRMQFILPRQEAIYVLHK